MNSVIRGFPAVTDRKKGCIKAFALEAGLKKRIRSFNSRQGEYDYISAITWVLDI